jgi:hypothetical protein
MSEISPTDKKEKKNAAEGPVMKYATDHIHKTFLHLHCH